MMEVEVEEAALVSVTETQGSAADNSSFCRLQTQACAAHNSSLCRADYLTTLEMAARWTYAMRQDRSRTIGARAQVGGGHFVMIGATHVALASGRSSFGLSHLATPFSLTGL